jgi:hypothetical protein
MPTNISERLIELSQVAHFLGRYDLTNMLIDLSVICNLEKLLTDEDLLKKRQALESHLEFGPKDTPDV